MIHSIPMQVQTVLSRTVSTLIAMQDPRATTQAPAPSQGGGGGGGGGSPLMTLLLPLLMIVFFYFVIIRPANKQRKEQENLLKGLQKGDRVVTSSGILGVITGLDENHITLEISEKVRVKFLREAVTRKVTENATPASAKSDDKVFGKTAEAKSKS